MIAPANRLVIVLLHPKAAEITIIGILTIAPAILMKVISGRPHVLLLQPAAEITIIGILIPAIVSNIQRTMVAISRQEGVAWDGSGMKILVNVNLFMTMIHITTQFLILRIQVAKLRIGYPTKLANGLIVSNPF